MLSMLSRKEARRRMSEEEIGSIALTEATKIVIRRTVFRGKEYIDIRKHVTSNKFTGFTKQGISIPMEKFGEILEIMSRAE